MDYLAPGEQQAERQASIRAWAALMLSPNPEVWGQLLAGGDVPADQLDTTHLDRAYRRRGL